MAKKHWFTRWVTKLVIVFVLIGCFLVFFYTPFYSKLIVKALDYFIPVEVNEVAAQSQRQASLSEHDSYEPGSNLWIARQAYLELMQNAIQHKNSNEIELLQARYKILEDKLIQQKAAEEAKEDNTRDVNIPVMSTTANRATDNRLIESHPIENHLTDNQSVSDPKHTTVVEQHKEMAKPHDAEKPRFDLKASEHKVLIQQYNDFLSHYPIENKEKLGINAQTHDDIAQLQKNENNHIQAVYTKPYAIVVLGGGLTADRNKNIVVNPYTRLRLEKTLEIHQKTNLPIVLSGVEAPYMQAWLEERGVKAKLMENRSMNTCENTRFSSLLLQKKGGAPTVLLVTDVYHMPRTRRLFALNGIATIPIQAPMPTQLTQWQPSEQNYDHSRRANYELLATLRDVLFGSSGCREVP